MMTVPAASSAGFDTATLGDMLRVAGSPGFDRWKEQIHRTGGCSHPIHLTGWTLTRDKTTGETLHRYSTDTEPDARLRIACGNRRASRCPACAWTYAGDTYHLIRAGLAGDDDRDIPAAVREHPRVFLTLTAPSFGPVHNRPGTRPCRCGAHHSEDDSALGTPLDPESYDYAAAVLFNNHAGQLWQRFTTRLRRDFRGHFSTKSRQYSTTLGELRQTRADYRAAQERTARGLDDIEPDTVLVLTSWSYAGQGHSPGEAALAASIARNIALNRETAREALRDHLTLEGTEA